MTEPRDDSLDRLLRQTLRDTDVGETPSCLDAEAMAAWMDGGLSGAALAAAEAHAATCARCRALVALIARSETVEQRPAVVSPASAGARGRRWLPWLVPLAAAALVALAIWIPRRESQPTQESTIALAPPAEPAPQPGPTGDRLQTAQQRPPTAAAQETPPVNAAKSRADLASNLRTAQTPLTTAPAPPVASPAPAATARPAVAVPAPVMVAQEPRLSAASAPPPRGFGLAASQTVIAEFESPRESAQAAPAGATSGRGGAGSGPGVAAAGGTRAAADGGASARGGGGRGGRGAAAGGGGLAAGGVAAPNAPQPTRWRVLASGLVERSNSPGAVWETVAVDLAGSAVTAGAAPSPLVCWLVGRNGVVFLSNDDGRTFSRVMFPEMVDLVAVRATSARAATVTTADGRTFATTDGGQTWSRD